MISNEYPKGSGLMIAKRRNSETSVSFRIYIPKKYAIGKMFVQKKTLKEAKDYCYSLYNNLKLSGKGLRGLTDSEMSEVQLAMIRCKKANVSLTEVLDYALPRMKTKGAKITLSELIEEYKALKSNLEGVSVDTYKSKYKVILEIVGNIKIADINKNLCKDCITKVEGGNRNKVNYYDYFKTLMTYAKSMDYILVNPFDSINKVEKEILFGRNPKKPEKINILSLQDVRLLLECARANPQLNMLPNYILQLFCGVRAYESDKLSWSDFRFNEKEPFVIIDENLAKNKSIRRAMIPENALKWFSLCDKNIPIGHKNAQQKYNCHRSILQKLGWGTWTKRKGKKPLWKNRKGLKNVLRHSFGSYHFDLCEKSEDTAMAMGHSDSNPEGVLFTNYRKLITKRGQGKEYFDITPKATGNKVISISSVA